MVMEEIYLLTKHAKFSPDYIEGIPVYKRRYYLNLLKTELEQTKANQDKAAAKAKAQGNVTRSRRR